MRSSFFEFHVAVSGLTTARAALNVTSNNVSNANTLGYSRQFVEQRATTPLQFNDGRGMIGTGSEVYGIGQIRSFYLDKKYWAESSILGEFTIKSTQAATLESLFNEPSDTGFNSVINNFFNKFQDLATNAENTTFRSNAVQASETLAKYFNSTSESLKRQQRDLNFEVKATVDQINTIGHQIVNLNKQIAFSELDGSSANDLRDRRALLVDELSLLVNIEVREDEMNPDYAAGKYFEPEDRGKSIKQYSIQIDGQDFINHFNMQEIQCRERTVKNNPEDVDGLYDLYWANTDTKINLTSTTLEGTLKGLIDVRDGNNKNSFTATTIEGVEVDSSGRYKLTISGASRDDLQYSGNLVINGKSYAFNSFEYDESTTPPTATLIIPPDAGKLTIANTVVNYSGLTYNSANNSFEFTISDTNLVPYISNTDIIRIGDMKISSGQLTYDQTTGIVSILNSSALSGIEAINKDLNISAILPQTGQIDVDGTTLDFSNSSLDIANSTYTFETTDDLSFLDPINNPMTIKVGDLLVTGNVSTITGPPNTISISDATVYKKEDLAASNNIPSTSGKLTLDGTEFTYAKLDYDSTDNSISFTVPAGLAPLSLGSDEYIKIGNLMVSGDNFSYDNATGEVTLKNIGSFRAPTDRYNMSVSNYTDYKGIPYYMNRLNELARTFARAVNDGHFRDGSDIPDQLGLTEGTNLYGDKGYPLFNIPAGGYGQITAETFSVNKEVAVDTGLLGIASSENPDVSDNNIAHYINELKHFASLFKEGEIGNYLQAIVGEIGVDGNHAYTFQKDYYDIVSTVQNQRLSVSSVSLDEEIANMVRFQQAYNASAKLVSIIDAIYDTTINRLGGV